MSILEVLIFLTPAAISVLFGWWSWRFAPDGFPKPKWREKFAFWGLIATTAGIVLESAFLLREYAFSYLPVGPLHELWQLTAWAAVLSWVMALLAALLGIGRVRWALLLYSVTSVMGCCLFIGRHD